MRSVEILRTDWERLRLAYPETSEEDLIRAITARGRTRLDEPRQESIDPQAPREQRLAWLRRWAPRKAGSVATLGFELVKNRVRLAEASELEGRVSGRYVELHREVIPGLKLRAIELRQEIRRLEEELRARGGDPDSVQPRVPSRIPVDDYNSVEFEGEESRRKTLDFFRRIGGDR
jgi:hypothetical protein